MTGSDIRNWLGLYFLLITSILAGYILLFSETPLLPISKDEGECLIAIIVPTFLSQITMAFRWFSRRHTDQEGEVLQVPGWTVKAPPVIAAALIVCAASVLILGNIYESAWTPSPFTFRAVVTLAVGLLNASTFLIMSTVFRS